MKTTLALLVLTLFAGCRSLPESDHVWYKEGGTPGERDRLLTAAEVQARQAYPDAPMAGASGTASTKSQASLRLARQDVVLRYMTAQGWRRVPREQAR
jgi:hypothetical protein